MVEAVREQSGIDGKSILREMREIILEEKNVYGTGVFTSMANGDSGNGGTIALLFWRAYFIPIGILSYRYFGKEK